LHNTLSYNDSITINPEIRFGKPCIKGTRIAVQDILGWLAAGMSVQEICEDFPELSEASIREAFECDLAEGYQDTRTEDLIITEDFNDSIIDGIVN